MSEAAMTTSAAPAATPASPRRRLWLLATLATALPLLVALCVTMWRAPFPISETVALMDDAGVLDDAPVAIDSPTLRSFFDPAIRWWYRPFYHLTWFSFWHLTGSLDRTLFLFKLIEVTAVAVLVLLFIWQLRPAMPADFAAATVAIGVLIALPAFRENLEIPMLYTLVGMPAILIVWMLLEREPRWWHTPAVVTLLVFAIGFKEQGLIIAALVVTGWWFGAPGATRPLTVTTVVAAIAYVAFRLSASGSWAPFEQEVGLGFGRLSADEASARFGEFPLPMYAYNVAATIANILFSEPTAGRFSTVESLVRGAPAPWQVIHLLSSVALTSLIVWWGVRTWRGNAGQPWSLESRVFAAVIVTVAASGALGFNYTRDRHGGMAAMFYALAAYFAVRTAAACAPRLSRGWMAAAAAGLLLLAGAWQVRAIGTIEAEHLRAMKIRREWLVDLQQERIEKAGRSRYLRILEGMAGQGVNPSAAPPTPYPASLMVWLRER